MSKIESLTPEQEAMMPVYVERFIEYGLSTDTSTAEDFQKCFEAAVALYRSFSEDLSDDPNHVPNDVPTHYEVYDSPRAIGLACKNSSFTNESGYGACEAGWLAHYIYMRDELSIEISENINHFYTIGQHCFWWYVDVSTKKVYFSRKPVEIHMVDGRLHNESGPSILFRDGFSVYSIDGFRVTEQIVMSPETMTLSQIDGEENHDIQSIMINRWFYPSDDWAKRFNDNPPKQTTGWLRFIDESGAKELDSDRNPLTQMPEILYRTKAGNRLIVGCPTARMFSIGMPPDIKSCAAAREWYMPTRERLGRTNFIGRT